MRPRAEDGRPHMESSSPKRNLGRRRPRTILKIVAVAALVLLACWAIITYRHARNLRDHLVQLKALEPARLDSLGLVLSLVQQDAARLRRDLSLPLAVAPYFGWLPSIGPTVAAAPVLVDAGTVMLDATADVWALVEGPVTQLVGDQARASDALEELSRKLADNSVLLESTAARVGSAVASIGDIDAERLHPKVSGYVGLAQALAPLASATFDALPLLPVLAPALGERNYLVLAQNSDEQRATGGFISSIGALTLRDGLPTAITFEDSYTVENWSKPHPDPPEPLREQMGLDLWVTRDANWWPDFSTSARAVAELYELNQERAIAGVVALDVYGAVNVIDALAPLELAGGGRVEQGQALEAFRESWSLPEGKLVTSGAIVTATRAFSGVDLELVYDDKAGRAWFDNVNISDLTWPDKNLARNPSFEEDRDHDGIPDSWLAEGLQGQDGLTDEFAHTGARSLLLVGQPQAAKRVTQRISYSGAAQTAFRVSAQSRSLDTNTNSGSYELTITFRYDDGISHTITKGFPPLTHDWATSGSDQIMGRWWRERKDFMNQMLLGAMAKVFGRPSEVRWLDLASAIVDTLDERHLQFYLVEEAAQAVVERHGWGGVMIDTPGDYLCLVDTNVGYNKVSASVTQAVNYRVALDDRERPSAQLSVLYRNQSTIDSFDTECDKFRQYVPTYEALTQGCYWDYVRLYVPQGSELVSARGGDEPFKVGQEAGRTVFTTSLVVRPGEERELVVDYYLPPRVARGSAYSLYAQKQAGTEAIPLVIAVTGAGGSTVIESNVPTPEVALSSVRWRTDLRVDRHITLQLPR